MGDVRKANGLTQAAAAKSAQLGRSVDVNIRATLPVSIRNVINRVMTAKHGNDWWTTQVAKGVRDRVKTRKEKEEKAPWHGKRGTHDINYSDYGDLKNILIKSWADFASLFPSQAWITQKLEELEPARNTLAHHNPVPENEQKRLDVYFDDWAAWLDTKKAQIP